MSDRNSRPNPPPNATRPSSPVFVARSRESHPAERPAGGTWPWGDGGSSATGLVVVTVLLLALSLAIVAPTEPAPADDAYALSSAGLSLRQARPDPHEEGPLPPPAEPAVEQQLAEQAVTAAHASRRAEAPAPTAAQAAAGRVFLESLGMNFGDSVDQADLLAAADRLGVHPDGWVRDEHLEQMRVAYLQRAHDALVGLGLQTGTQVDDSDLQRGAALVGVDLGAGPPDPADVDALVRAVPDWRGGPTPVFAVAGGVNVRVPSRVATMIGFHQASYAVAMPLWDKHHPLNRLLPSRGRGTSRVSAADVRVPPGTTVLSPVRGTVVEVTPYNLYGKYPDWKIRFAPDPNPGLLVTVLHVTDPLVQVGQHVEAGDPLARHATQFPFESQIDHFAGRGPHVHVEARAR